MPSNSRRRSGAAEIMVVQASSHDEWDRRWAKVDKKDADELLALAEWAQSKKMTNKARLCYRKVLRIERQNKEAQEGQGEEEAQEPKPVEA